MLVGPSGQPIGGNFQRWAYRMRVPSVARVTFGIPPGSSCAWDGCYWLGGPVWVSPHTQLADLELYHELGHAYDYQHMTDRDRREAARLMGDVGKHWDEATDSQGGASDDFADNYAFCAFRRGRAAWQWEGLLSPRKTVKFCSLIVRVRNQAGEPGVMFTPQTP